MRYGGDSIMYPPERHGEEYLARGFRDVDAAAVGKMVRCLTYMDGLPEFQQYKNTILEMMNAQAGSITADLGCGLVSMSGAWQSWWVLEGGQSAWTQA
jgi:hypothetical protein